MGAGDTCYMSARRRLQEADELLGWALDGNLIIELDDDGGGVFAPFVVLEEAQRGKNSTVFSPVF